MVLPRPGRGRAWQAHCHDESGDARNDVAVSQTNSHDSPVIGQGTGL